MDKRTDSKNKIIGYQIFNYTDNIYASAETIYTLKKAKIFIREFRNRYKKQGYYRNNRLEKINPKHIDLEIIPADFSPFRKSN